MTHWLRNKISRSATSTALLLLLFLGACAEPQRTDDVTVAVAANFLDTASQLSQVFESIQGARVTLIAGSSGKLYAQIRNGAPFDVFLSADEARAYALEEAGAAVSGSGFVYAEGRLSLWSKDGQRDLRDGAEILRSGTIDRLAIANPELAPYGLAAREVLQALGAWERLQARIVKAENVTQVYAMVATGNAELGLLSRATVMSPANRIAGSHWDVPAALHAPIRQRVVLLQRGLKNEAAKAYLEFLGSPEALRIIRAAGYDAG